MSTIIMRSALVAHGHNPGPDVARVEIDYPGGPRRVITWADVMADRRTEQARRLRLKRESRQVRAYRVWVAYFDQDLMGGWHAFVDDFRGRNGRTWIRGPNKSWGLPARLRKIFPACSEGLPWERWMIRFARIYQRGWHDGKPRGSAFFWWDGSGVGEMRPATPEGR